VEERGTGMEPVICMEGRGCMWRSREGKDSVERKEDIDVFTYTFVLPLVMLVSEHRECECVAEEKDFPPLLCCAICLVLPCLGVCFVSSPITRRFIAAVIRRPTIVDLQKEGCKNM